MKLKVFLFWTAAIYLVVANIAGCQREDTSPKPETTESKPDYKLEAEKHLIRIVRADIKAGYVESVKTRLGNIPKDSPNYAEAQSIILTITPQMIKLAEKRQAREDAKQERDRQETRKSIDSLYKEYAWCMVYRSVSYALVGTERAGPRISRVSDEGKISENSSQS